MVDRLALVAIGCCLLLAAWSGVMVALDRRIDNALLLGLAGAEVVLIAQVVVAVVLLAVGDRPTNLPAFVGYLIASLATLPAGTVWALAERSRSGTAVLAVVCLVLSVLVLRLQQVWGA